MSDVVLDFRAKHLLQKKRCRVCQTKKDLLLFGLAGERILKTPDHLVFSESDKWIAMCTRHKHLRESYRLCLE